MWDRSSALTGDAGEVSILPENLAQAESGEGRLKVQLRIYGEPEEEM